MQDLDTALHVAAYHGHIGVVELLLQYMNAQDVNLQNDVRLYKSYRHVLVMFYSLSRGHQARRQGGAACKYLSIQSKLQLDIHVYIGSYILHIITCTPLPINLATGLAIFCTGWYDSTYASCKKKESRSCKAATGSRWRYKRSECKFNAKS